MREFFARILGLVPNLEPKLESIQERADHLRRHVIRMEEKLEHIEQAINRLLERAGECK